MWSDFEVPTIYKMKWCDISSAISFNVKIEHSNWYKAELYMDQNIHTWHEVKGLESKNTFNVSNILPNFKVPTIYKMEWCDISSSITFDVIIEDSN